ncbi:hypothetical protein F2Q68_00041910 [Brassica cretica]|uniref:Uncharacterized protein n=1 Tax=Brassica cretica TaxID=69181 RepID=A0A8S9MAG1_BRACR|nr:hypothetical protein F2Q68_00041910 [Brassica cretica]
MVVCFWCRLSGYFFVSPVRRSSEAQEHRARFSSFGSRRRSGPSVLKRGVWIAFISARFVRRFCAAYTVRGSWCAHSSSVHGVLLRRCYEKSGIRGNEVNPTFLRSTSMVENMDCIFEDLRNRLTDGVG